MSLMALKNEVDSLVHFIDLEVKNANKDGCIVGVSGGVDSAVIVSLCKLAFPQSTYGLSMPCSLKINSDSTKRALELCNNLKVELFKEDISPRLTIKDNSTSLSLGNYYARQRMANLYFYAENLHLLVIGTDNKSENYIGYFTKYGDGGVDINPIGQYYKSEVYELAKYLGVPKSILEAAPSAELWDGQTDETEIGMTYDELESCIKWLSLNLNSRHVTKPDMTHDKINLVNRLHKVSEHKRIIPKEYERYQVIK
jgi:NAD+ synthase